MPTYDYTCQACGRELEIFQSMTERPKRKCPECGALRMKRHIGTGAGFVFKGSGFYETDYRSASYKAGEKQASESRSSSEGKDKSKGDDKSKGNDKSKGDDKSSSKDAGSSTD